MDDTKPFHWNRLLYIMLLIDMRKYLQININKFQIKQKGHSKPKGQAPQVTISDLAEVLHTA